MIRKLLVANRGEIACRIFATCDRLGVATVAAYSDADAEARHVALAGEAIRIGPAPARDSYLRGDAIVAAALRAGADAVHPGYGFLSENAEFAEACAAAGLVFVGPPPAAIRAMGTKSGAKALMERAGVPLTPGHHGDAQDVATFARAAARIGYPVLVKASAGGGGRGMRVVDAEAGLGGALDSARREAEAAFGDGRLLLEKWLDRPRHVEVQVFADAHGAILALGDRDCSIQRRHQKVIEEAPAPGLDPAMRAAMAQAAVAAARAVGYVGAGTVEFIVAGGAFHFMEMNTRLQVEHPVTEMTTGLDLVEWQLRVASGERLPIGSADVRSSGHAIEVRVCAEDPARDFLPSTGEIARLRWPREGADVRVDSGVREGDRVGSDYDALLAKLIVRGADRADAVARLARALDACELVGIATNLDLLRAVAAHPGFADGAPDTGFLAREAEALVAGAAPSPEDERAIVAAAAMAALSDVRAAAADRARRDGDPWSPWALADG
ncbi:MAG: ATP-grasp domain-containing protein, partial [Hyphomicrobiales bacterium]|nr:ATP-grasp domain-containing protein [Hyphomicrobiales bacterium]